MAAQDNRPIADQRRAAKRGALLLGLVVLVIYGAGILSRL